MRDDIKREFERRDKVGEERKGERSSAPSWKSVLIVLLTVTAASFPLWSVWLYRLGLISGGAAKGEITVSVPHAVEVVDTNNDKTYTAPSQFKVSTVPDVLEVKPVPGTGGGDYTLSVAGKAFTGNVYPGRVDRYQVVRTQDGDIDLVKLIDQSSCPALGGQ